MRPLTAGGQPEEEGPPSAIATAELARGLLFHFTIASATAAGGGKSDEGGRPDRRSLTALNSGLASGLPRVGEWHLMERGRHWGAHA
jgi:hypothetical protein